MILETTKLDKPFTNEDVKIIAKRMIDPIVLHSVKKTPKIRTV